MSFTLAIAVAISFLIFKFSTTPNKDELKEKIKHTSKKALFYSMLILRVSYYLILQKLNKSVIQLNKNTYEITYMLKNKIYKFRTSVRRGPTNAVVEILGSTKEGEESGSEGGGRETTYEEAKEIEPYLGPNLNFHNIFYTPADFGYKKLIFVLEDGTEQTFKEKEMITLMV